MEPGAKPKLKEIMGNEVFINLNGRAAKGSGNILKTLPQRDTCLT